MSRVFTRTEIEVRSFESAVDQALNINRVQASAGVGDIVQGANVTMAGTLEGRLIGPGDVTISASGGGGGGSGNSYFPGGW
jgi:hypothetical protein